MKEITSKDYDVRVQSHSLDQIIDIYYRPKQDEDRRRVRCVLDALAPAKGQKILDLGCGVGTFAFHASVAGAQCWGIDYSPESIKTAQVLCRRFAQSPRFMVADASRLPFTGHFFDKVVAADFIEHVTLKDKDAILKEILRVVKPGGFAVIYTPNGIREKIGEWYWKIRHAVFGHPIPGTDLHFGLTTRREFERLLADNGFRFRLRYDDVTRPYLARVPVLRSVLALNLLWIAYPPGGIEERIPDA